MDWCPEPNDGFFDICASGVSTSAPVSFAPKLCCASHRRSAAGAGTINRALTAHRQPAITHIENGCLQECHPSSVPRPDMIDASAGEGAYACQGTVWTPSYCDQSGQAIPNHKVQGRLVVEKGQQSGRSFSNLAPSVSSTGASSTGNQQLLYSTHRCMHKAQPVECWQQQWTVHRQGTATVEMTGQRKYQHMLLQHQALLAEQRQAEEQALTAALASSSAAASAAASGSAMHMHPMALYGNHTRAGAVQPQCHQAAVPGASLPPRPAVSSHAKQQAPVLGFGCGASSAQLPHGVCNSAISSAAPYSPASAGCAQLMGRWSGPIAVMTTACLDNTSEGNAAGSMECEEDLLFSIGDDEGCLYYSSSDLAAAACNSCIEAAEAKVQEGLADYIDESGSSDGIRTSGDANHMEEDQDRDTDAAADQDGAAACYADALQVLDRVATLRKGSPALSASTAASTAAGAESVRSRMLITEVSVYMDRAANSQMALDQANKLMSKMTLPDGVEYMPVSTDSFLFKAGAAWQFPAFVICLGSSYLQRMLARLPQLAEAALACPGFEDYSQYLPDLPPIIPERLSGSDAIATIATLRSVQFTCLFLATKVADQIHALGLLRFMLTNLSHNGAVVTLQQAANVEAGCLEALEWRLGPFFMEDDLSGADEVLWAESMGHWDYGTSNDTYPEHF